jgi:peptidoglycan/xylan/chitin deacetylase (PgdA/CDA1 family)
MKQAVLNLMRVTGAFAPFRIANRDKALILTYHRFSNSGDDQTTSARAFSDQLRYLTSHYQLVALSSLATYLSRGVTLPSGIASIVIDDGYRDAYEIAFPILRQYRIPATLFVVTGFVDRMTWLWTDKLRFLLTRTKLQRLDTTINNRSLHVELGEIDSRLRAAGAINAMLKQMPDGSKDKVIMQIAASVNVDLPDVPPTEYGPITWDQARELDISGVEIGSHTVTHPILTRVGDERLRLEVFDSRSRIEAMLDREVDLFCYPNGNYDERVALAVSDAGYKCAVTVDPGFNGMHSDPLRLRRVHTENNFARFVQSTSGFEQIRNRVVYASKRAAVATFR